MGDYYILHGFTRANVQAAVYIRPLFQLVTIGSDWTHVEIYISIMTQMYLEVSTMTRA